MELLTEATLMSVHALNELALLGRSVEFAGADHIVKLFDGTGLGKLRNAICRNDLDREVFGDVFDIIQGAFRLAVKVALELAVLGCTSIEEMSELYSDEDAAAMSAAGAPIAILK